MALNLEHRDLSVSVLVEDFLPNIKKQVEDNVVGYVEQPLDKFRLQPHSLRNYKQKYHLTNLVFTRPERWL